MLTERELEILSNDFYKRINEVNTEYLELLGRRFKQIGEISATDKERLTIISKFTDDDLKKLIVKLQSANETNAKEIESLINTIADDVYKESRDLYVSQGLAFQSIKDNEYINNYIQDKIKSTKEDLNNLSRTSALSSSYKEAINKAVLTADLGLDSYSTAIRKTLRETSDLGIHSVEYANGTAYRRRVDSAVRQNVLAGMKDTNLKTAERIGEQIGNDGWEISYHSNPRDTHVEMGGKQYTLDEFVKNDIESLLMDYGCLHYKRPILIGISEPSYTDKELKKLKDEDARTFEYNGKEITKYEASQVQRRLETAIRSQKDLSIISKSSGDTLTYKQAKSNITALNKEYESFSKLANLPTQKERLTVSGYR